MRWGLQLFSNAALSLMAIDFFPPPVVPFVPFVFDCSLGVTMATCVNTSSITATEFLALIRSIIAV